jgi:hypothetical protein
LLALSLLVTAALLEGLLRALGRELLPSPELYVEDLDTGKRMRPGWQGDEFGAPVKINSKGLRNPEVDYARPPGTYRILALGDSWTFGFRLEEPDSYPRQLERALEERARGRGDPRRFQVINAGVIGYSTDQEAAWLRAEGHRYQPDLVLLAYYPVNDTHSKLGKYRFYSRLRDIHPWLLELYTFPDHLYLREFIKGARRMLKRHVGQARVAVAERLGVEDEGSPSWRTTGPDRTATGTPTGRPPRPRWRRSASSAASMATRRWWPCCPTRSTWRATPTATTRASPPWCATPSPPPERPSSTSSRSSARGATATPRSACRASATPTPSATA